MFTEKEISFLQKRLTNLENFDHEELLKIFNARRERDGEPFVTEQNILDHLEENIEDSESSDINPAEVISNSLNAKAQTKANLEMKALINPEPKEYRIAEGSSAGDCAKTVNMFIKGGWVPIGGICYADRGVGSSLTGMKTHFQALVKY